MNVLILDQDPRGTEYLSGLLRSEFSDLTGHFTGSGQQALEALQQKSYDIVLMENNFPDDELFGVLKGITDTGTPVIIVGSDTSERMIVELLHAGASDFISKRNIKFGYLPSLIRRALLKNQGQSISETLNQEIRSHMKEDREAKRRYHFSRGLISNEKAFVEGQSYNLIYIYIFLPFAALQGEDGDAQQVGNFRRELMEHLMGIPGQYGGETWNQKEDTILLVFNSTDVMGAVLTVLEMRGMIRTFNLMSENLHGQFLLRTGITRSPAIYRENHGDIVSDGINLSAHMAFASNEEENILVTEELFSEMTPRARKYFFKGMPFEGHPVYRYETTA